MRDIDRVTKSNNRLFYVSLFTKYGFLVFLLLWGEPDILGGIVDILKVIADYISHSIGGGIG